MIFDWRNFNQVVSKLQDLRVISKNGDMECPEEYCDGHLKLQKDAERADYFRWYCDGSIRHGKKKVVKCSKRVSVRHNTFFYNSNLPLWKIAAFCHLWVEKCPLKFIMKQLSIAAQTAIDWAGFCREIVFDAFVTKATKIGGPGIIVEIDESKFGKRKYQRGHHVEGAWVFGGYERGSGKVFMVVVEDRTAETLLTCIERFIEPGTTIYSDCWKGYSGLKDHPSYENLQVNHSVHFKDPETGVHTNSIESSWRHDKAAGPYANRQKGFLGGYLARYMFLKLVNDSKQDPLTLFFMLARDLYDPVALTEARDIEGSNVEGGDSDMDNDFN